MNPLHHPTDEILLDYAFGGMREPMALVVATHMVFCPVCRDTVARFERVGGGMLSETKEAAMSGDALTQVLDRLDDSVDDDESKIKTSETALPGVPSPLWRYLDAPLEKLPWRPRGRAFFEHRLLTDSPGHNVKILKIPAGHGTPLHSHEGTELTVVLKGGFRDDTGHYLPGDLAQADDTLVHRPVADDDGDCICLAATDGDIRLAGPISRWLNPFIKY